mgnify:CR=1 FL=1
MIRNASGCLVRNLPMPLCEASCPPLTESLKGNRSRSALGMPRKAHRRGGAVRERGVSTRRLGHYLAWFQWSKQVRRSGSSSSDSVTCPSERRPESRSSNAMPCPLALSRNLQ